MLKMHVENQDNTLGNMNDSLDTQVHVSHTTQYRGLFCNAS